MKLLRALALLIVVVAGFGVPKSVVADTPWKTMHRNTYPATAASARAQCMSELRLGHVPGLTAEKCAMLERKLDSGDYSVVTSQVGQNYHSVAGVGPDRVQQLNFEPRALRVDLGDGVIVHWFTGEDRSCNNVGFAKPVVLPPKQTSKYTYMLPLTSFYVGPLDVCGCVDIPGVAGQTPGSTFTVQPGFGVNDGGFGVTSR